MRRIIITMIGVLVGTVPVAAGFGIFQVNGPNPLPPSVTLHAIDGGPTYMADHGLTQAMASFTDAAGTTYANGWDTPTYFAHMVFLGYLDTAPHITNFQNFKLNGAFGFSAPTTGLLNTVSSSHMQNVMFSTYMGQFQGNDRLPGSETVGFWLYDEPSYAELVGSQIQGYPATTFTMTSSGGNATVATTPTGGVPILGGWFAWAGNANGGCPNNSSAPAPCMLMSPFLDDSSTGAHITPNTYMLCTQMGVAGSYQICSNGGGVTPPWSPLASETVTQIAYPGYSAALQDGRILSVGLGGLTFFNGKNINCASGTGCVSGSMPASTFVGQTYTAPSSKVRHLDLWAQDLFWFVIGHSDMISGNNNQSLSNAYDTSNGSPPMTLAQAANGARYGDSVDIMRSFVTGSTIPAPGILNFQEIETGDCKCGIPQIVIQPVEIAWGVWSSIIHGARGIVYFDNDDGFTGINTAGPENIHVPYYQNARSVTFTGSIATTTLTVSTSPTDTVGAQTNSGAGILMPGMVCTSGCNGTVQIQQQLTHPAAATFTISSLTGTNNVTMAVSGVTGTIIVPSILTGTGVTGRSLSANHNIVIRAGSGPYTIDGNTATPSGTITSTPAYGGQGTYKISGGGTVTGGGSQTLTFQQQFGRGNNAPTSMSMTGLITEMGQEIKDLAPVINSQFAYGYISASPPGYRFEDGFSVGVPAGAPGQTCSAGSAQTIQTFAYGTCTGIEVMAKRYTGSSYSASTGETISPGFYVFADTRFPSTSLSTDIGTVTYTLGTSGCNGASVATVIGESRTRPISSCQFTDTFNNAWTYHVYKIQ